MLPFVALLLFAILGIAALNIDMGLAFGTKAHLESTAETLALERSRLDTADEESELRGLLEALIGSSPQDPASPPNGASGMSPLPIEGPLLGEDGEVELSQRIPLLFGMAAVPTRNSEGLSLRQLREARENGTGLLESGGLRGRGLAPGGRARALERPVMRVGFPQPGAPGGRMPGLADVALDLSALQNPPAGPPILGGELYVDEASGQLRHIDSEGPAVGWVIAHDSCLSEPCPGWRVGDPLQPNAGSAPAVFGDAYVAVFDPARCDRVVGYVGATLLTTETGLRLLPSERTVTENASAVPDPFDPAAGGGGCASLQVADVLDLGRSLPLLQVAVLGGATEAP